MTYLARLNLPKFDFMQNRSGGMIIKFQQSQALTSHFESFWSMVIGDTVLKFWNWKKKFHLYKHFVFTENKIVNTANIWLMPCTTNQEIVLIGKKICWKLTNLNLKPLKWMNWRKNCLKSWMRVKMSKLWMITKKLRWNISNWKMKCHWVPRIENKDFDTISQSGSLRIFCPILLLPVISNYLRTN